MGNLICVAVGLLLCFAGVRVQKVCAAILGFVWGALASTVIALFTVGIWAMTDTETLVLIAFGAVLVSIVSAVFDRACAMISSFASVGMIVLIVLLTKRGYGFSPDMLFWAVALGVVAAGIVSKFYEYGNIIITAFSGAVLASLGGWGIFNGYELVDTFIEILWNGMGGKGGMIFAMLVLTVAGFAVQNRYLQNKKEEEAYEAKKKAAALKKQQAVADEAKKTVPFGKTVQNSTQPKSENTVSSFAQSNLAQSAEKVCTPIDVDILHLADAFSEIKKRMKGTDAEKKTAFDALCQIQTLLPNHAEVNVLLGECYWCGFGTERSNEKTIEHMMIAANNGSSDAQTALGWWYSIGATGLLQDEAESFKWLSMAAEVKNPKAMSILGTFYQSGRGGVAVDDRKAAECFMIAAEHDIPSAMYRLATQYYYGEGVEKSVNKAEALYQRIAAMPVADLNVPFSPGISPLTAKDAAGMLCHIYLVDRPNNQKLHKYRQMAAKLEDSEEQLNLGRAYWFGEEGAPKDLEKAKYWLEKALAHGEESAGILLERIPAEKQRMQMETQSKERISSTREYTMPGQSAGKDNNRPLIIGIGSVIIVLLVAILIVNIVKKAQPVYETMPSYEVTAEQERSDEDYDYALDLFYSNDPLPNGEEDPEWFYYDLDTRYISEYELYEFSDTQLVYIRNSIYAMEGRPFKDAELREYFESKDWYEPNGLSDSELRQRMNSYQRENLDLIVRYEDSR